MSERDVTQTEIAEQVKYNRALADNPKDYSFGAIAYAARNSARLLEATAANAHPDLLARIEELEDLLRSGVLARKILRAVGFDLSDSKNLPLVHKATDAARATLSKEGGVK